MLLQYYCSYYHTYLPYAALYCCVHMMGMLAYTWHEVMKRSSKRSEFYVDERVTEKGDRRIACIPNVCLKYSNKGNKLFIIEHS